MIEFMKKVAQLRVELTVEERNLFSVAFKSEVGARRAAWRVISAAEQKAESKADVEKHLKIVKDYRAKIEKELVATCKEVLQLIDDVLVPSATTGESKVFYSKM
jgi:14-3-3 protein epsilon